MKVEQIYTGCLAKGAYYIESNGEVVIVDPLRNTENYIERAKANGEKIKYVLETHFNPVYVSSLLNLVKTTGATLVYGPTAQLDFEAYIAKDNEELKFGNVSIKVIHTPGHSMESTTYLLKDEKGKDYAIFTGDTLFFGELGGTDLTIKKEETTHKALAGLFFDSLRNKIMPLADEVIVYPGHGVGSACGKKIIKETERTLGNQKKVNYALRADMTKSEFVKEVLSGSVNVLQGFSGNKMMEKTTYQNSEKVHSKGDKPLTIRAFKAAWEMEEAVVLDTRSKAKFAKGFIPGAIFMGIDGSFSRCIAALINDLNRPILFIAEPGGEEEVMARLENIGYSNVIGFLDGGFKTWKEAGEQIDTVEEVSSLVFAELYKRKNLNVLDVRKKGERNAGLFDGVEKFPLDCINENMNLINRGEKHYLHCKNGYRSLIAVSILKARGIHDVVNVKGGFNELSRLYQKRTKYKKQVSKM